MARPRLRLKQPRVTEGDFQKAVKIRFDERLTEAVYFHVPNGEARDGRVGAMLKEMGVLPGVADWIILHRGRALALELKRDRNKPSDRQLVFMRRWHANGGVYFVAWTLQDVDLFLALHGVK